MREAIEKLRDELSAMEITAKRKTKVGRAAEAVVHLVRVRLDETLAASPQAGAQGEGGQAKITSDTVQEWREKWNALEGDPTSWYEFIAKHVNALLASPPSGEPGHYPSEDYLQGFDDARKARASVESGARPITNLSQEDYNNLVRDAMLWRKHQTPAPSEGNESARERECKVILTLMGNEPYLAKGHVENGEYHWTVVADKISVRALAERGKEESKR